MKLYARVNGQLSVYQTAETDPEYARNDVLHHLDATLGSEAALACNPVLALIEGGK